MITNGILIDPFAKKVEGVKIDCSDIANIHAIIGCEVFTAVRISKTDSIFVDDEALINQLHTVDGKKVAFICDLYRQPLIGKGLILGHDDEGETIDPKVTVKQISSRIMWLRLPDQPTKR